MKGEKVGEVKGQSQLDRVVFWFDCLEIESCLHGGRDAWIGILRLA